MYTLLRQLKSYKQSSRQKGFRERISTRCNTKLTTKSEFVITKILITATFKNTQLHRQVFSTGSQILNLQIY